MPLVRLPVVAALALAAAACAQRPASPSPAVAADRPLAGLAGQQVVVLPVHYLRGTDSLRWETRVGAPREFLGRLDDEIAFALRERGFRDWAFAEQLARSARRNAGFAPDPHALTAESMRPRAGRRAAEIPEPLASQVRALVALHDARLALFPVEVRFEDAGAGTARAVLHVVLLDARSSEIVWMADIPGDAAAAPTPATSAVLAGRLADLVAAR
jgi:hypothetical protein